MKISGIQNELSTSHNAFKTFVMAMDERAYLNAPVGKWNAGQQLSHVLKSAKAINRGLSLPKIQLKIMFGKSNRPSRTFEGLVQRYNEKLQDNYEQPKDFAPDTIDYENREVPLSKFVEYAERIGRRLAKMGEEDADKFVLPHPLLGKLTFREFGYFTIYHCQHHLRLIQKYSQS